MVIMKLFIIPTLSESANIAIISAFPFTAQFRSFFNFLFVPIMISINLSYPDNTLCIYQNTV